MDVYGGIDNLPNGAARSKFVVERAILTPLNDDVDMLNDKIMNRFPCSQC